MRNELSILLIEDDVKTCSEIQNYIDNIDDINLAGITNNAHDALEMVQAFLPDVILLDLELHQGGGNGLLFLMNLNQLALSIRPYILVTTHNVSEVTFESARHLGADFILAKYESGYSAEYVVEFIRMIKTTLLNRNSAHDAAQASPPPDKLEHKLAQRVQRELSLVGISPKAVAYRYLIDAILITTQRPGASLTHILADKYGKSDASIERAMQNAINRAWRTNDPDDLLKYYTARIRSDRGVPTLMEFIYYYATKIENDIE